MNRTNCTLAALAAVGLALVSASPISADEPVTAPEGVFDGSGEIALAAENNHLNAYSVDTGERFRVITSAHDAVDAGRDINGQVCFDPVHSGRFVAGEDTGQGGDGVAGWGYFELVTDEGEVHPDDLLAGEVDGIGARQIGKLAPAYLGAPDNHGCGFLSDGSLVTATIGNTYPGEPANGELILWFRDEHEGFGQAYSTHGRDGTATNTPFGDVPYCKLATDLATAGGVHVDGDDDVYVAVNRPQGGADGNPLGGEPGGIRRFSFTDGIPTPDDCHEETILDQATGAEVTEQWVDEGVVTSEQLFIDVADGQVGPLNAFAATPSGITASDHGTFYVSSVFTGAIVEVSVDGSFVRPILLPGEGAVIDGGTTPFGLALDSNGDLWVADLGIVAVAPAPMAGSIVRIPIDDGTGLPGVPVAVDRMLTYPDGVGIATVDLT